MRGAFAGGVVAVGAALIAAAVIQSGGGGAIDPEPLTGSILIADGTEGTIQNTATIFGPASILGEIEVPEAQDWCLVWASRLRAPGQGAERAQIELTDGATAVRCNETSDGPVLVGGIRLVTSAATAKLRVRSYDPGALAEASSSILLAVPTSPSSWVVDDSERASPANPVLSIAGPKGGLEVLLASVEVSTSIADPALEVRLVSAGEVLWSRRLDLHPQDYQSVLAIAGPAGVPGPIDLEVVPSVATAFEVRRARMVRVGAVSAAEALAELDSQ